MSNNALLFVRSEIDDLGLSPAAFRILAHLFRRLGGPRSDPEKPPGIPSIMRHCRLSKGTVRSALKELEDSTGLKRIERDGRAWGFVLPTLETLREPGYLFNPGQKKGRPKVVGRRGQSNTHHPSQEKGDEGDSGKGILEKGILIEPDRPALTLSSVSEKKTRKRDEAFEALAIGCRINPAEITPAMGGRLGKALKDIRTVTPSVTANEISARIRRWVQLHPDPGTLTPTAIAANWAALGAQSDRYTPAQLALLSSGPPIKYNDKPEGAIDAIKALVAKDDWH